MNYLKKLPDKELDSITLSFWHDISVHPCLMKLLNYCEQQYKGKYSEEQQESIHSHLQAERNGGQKGWNRLQNLLLNPPDYTPTNSVSVTETPKKNRFQQETFGISHTEE